MEPLERAAVSPRLLADEDVSQSVGQTSINPLGGQSQSSENQDQRQPRMNTDGLELPQSRAHSLQLDFQDSNLSPALHLLPVNSGVENNFTEYSLFQQSDTEFAPLRAYPDVSMASERFHFPALDRTSCTSECGSLSQHPLAQETLLSEEGESSSSCSLSQHSLSLQDQHGQEETVHPSVNVTDSRNKDQEAQNNLLEKALGEAAEDETFFLRKDVRAQHLLELLQKDVDMPSSSSSAVSSQTSVTEEITDQRMVRREGPPGEASLPQQQTQQPDRVSNLNQSRAPFSELSNITMGSRSTQPDDSSEELRRVLVSEVETRSSREAESKNRSQKTPTAPAQSHLTPYPKQRSEGQQSAVRANQSGALWTLPFSAGVERVHREQSLWSSGNQTGIDGSYLGFLPQSQSTPGVLKSPPKSSARPRLGQLSAIESDNENSRQSSLRIAAQSVDIRHTNAANQGPEDAASARVHSLPSLNYIQKVDAWRANQSSGKTSLFDSLALQGFSGVSPKKKAYDAVSDSLNRILSQQVRSLQQPLLSGAASPNVLQNSSTVPSSSSSPRRGEAVGSAPSEKDNAGPAAPPSSSPFGRSQSHSSLSTVVMSFHKDQQTDGPPEKDKSQSQGVPHHHPNTAVEPSPRMSLGRFSDVSLEQDLTLSSSQDSYSEVKVGTSVGASSIVSLEIDNYAPYWTSKLSTPPPRPREINIDERIPHYLHNLGIDQSPSTILTPFAPRGPIREPEFSPTDLLTIKGSIGTPTKSAQPSEGSSPHKGEYSRSSILSVDSSISIPFSLDSLGPAVSVSEQIRRPSSDTEAIRSERRLATFSEPEQDSRSSRQQRSQQQRESNLTSSQKINQPGDNELDSSVSLAEKRNLNLQRRSVEQNTEESFVSSQVLSDIRKLLSHAENMLSTGSSAASSTSPAAPRLLSDENIFQSLRKKTSKLQESSVSSSFTAGDPRTGSPMMWARSSSDSMLTSEKLRQSSVGRESLTSSWQPDYPSTQTVITAPATVTYKTQDSTVSSGPETSPVLSKSARRTEPEGCSAAPPDKVPPQPAVSNPPPAVSKTPLTSTPADTAEEEEEEEEEEETTPGSPAQSSSSSPILEDADQEVMSDGSSGSSLAVRVAKLLQSESPATMVSTTTSFTDHEESRAREWIRLKISGQKCEPLELHQEDRMRIEEIKRELLLKNPPKSQGSTDTDSSSAFSFRMQDLPDSPPSAETFTTLSEANKPPTQPLQDISTNPPDSDTQPPNPPRPDLEAKVCEIAAREGVTLPIKNRGALTSITIATCRRSTSPSPSTSPAPPLSPDPEPLHITELHTDAASSQIPPHLDAELPQVPEPCTSLHTGNETPQSAPGSQKRQDTVGGQFEESPSPSQHSDDKLSVVDDGTHQAAASSDVKSPARTSHISHVHLTLSPKATDHSSTTAVHPGAVSGLPPKEFVPLRHSPSAAISPDEGVGLSSPPEWFDTRESVRQQPPERSDTSTLFTSVVPQEQMTSTSTQSFTTRHRSEISPRSFTTTAPVPVLLPYKPHGSEDFFYVPQTEAYVSSGESSDTTMESSHTGSDDAVPPRFSSDVLGHQDPGLDRGVTIRHSEGIYSKRLRTAASKMQESAHEDSSISADRSSQPSVNQTPNTSSQVSPAFNRVPSSSSQEALKRDQGTSPIQFLQYDQPESSWDTFQTVHMERSSDQGSSPVVQAPVSAVFQTREERDHQRRDSDHFQSQQSSSSLDQLWQKFCDQWSTEDSRPTRDSEASLLERLERLSRLIHGTRAGNVSRIQEEEDAHPEPRLERRREEATQRRKERKQEVKRSRKAETHIQLRLQEGETSPPAEDDSRTSFSSSSCLSQHLSPADRDESETLSTVSGSMSSVDTTRLIRVFGADRVQHLKSSSSLSKLYRTIDKQRDGREQRRGRTTEHPHIIRPTETTDQSVSADSSSTSTYTVSSLRGPSRTLAAKKVVKLVNKGVQAGDLEIVSNGTRRHTRDVGTTFPSPGDARALSRISSSSSSGGRRGQRSPSKSQTVQKQRKSKKSPSKRYPAGVSWFISADSLKSDWRKENQPEEEPSSWRPSSAWFEPYSRIPPWREPLRQRHVQEDRNRQSSTRHPEPEPDPGTKTGLTRASLQEALEMSRPEFISRSRQRMKRLALQVQERKLQAVFSRERDELFDQPGRPMRLPKPAGTALLKRAVPRKEMIQRSKQIYETLPEVQMRKEEERRKAEYRSYRLNAQLYNKRITNRVLGRRSAWQ